jgi:repressor LexA
VLDLTERQKDYLEFIIDFKQKHGYSPTYNELGDGMGVNSSAALDTVRVLNKKGYIHSSSNISRSIVVLKLPEGR